MPGAQDWTKAIRWHREIRRRSRKALDYLKGLLAVVVVLFLLAVVLANALIPENTASAISLTLPAGITLTYRALSYLSAVGAGVALLFSLKVIPPLRNWYEPQRKRYRPASFEIIDELRSSGHVNEPKANALKDIALRHLGAVEGDDATEDPAEQLLRASCDLAEEMAR